MAILTVKNRWKEPFTGMYDAQEYTVVDTLAVPDYVARHIKSQSIIRDNPVTGDNDYQLAIIEDGDDQTPLVEIPVESLDRADMPDFRKVVIKGSGVRIVAPMPGSKGQRGDQTIRTTE